LLIDQEPTHRSLYQVFLDIRDAAAKILENTTLADLVNPPSGGKHKKRSAKKREPKSSVLPMVVGGSGAKG